MGLAFGVWRLAFGVRRFVLVLVLVLENDCTGANLLWRRSANHWTNGLNSPSPIEDENEVLSGGSGIRSERDDRVRRPDSYEGGNRIVRKWCGAPGGQLHSPAEGTSGLEWRHG